MHTPSRMEVNAAIETLIARNDSQGEAAKIVVLHGHGLKKSKGISITYSGTDTSDQNSISGHTAEHGQVDFSDNDKNENIEKSWGIYKDRVGHYRLWKKTQKLLVFHHFWKSSITTERADGSGPDEYYLCYNPETLEPVYFGVERHRVVFRIGYFLTISKRYLEPIYGRPGKTGLGWLIE